MMRLETMNRNMLFNLFSNEFNNIERSIDDIPDIPYMNFTSNFDNDIDFDFLSTSNTNENQKNSLI